MTTRLDRARTRIRAVWRDAGLPERCYVRTVRGAYRDVLVVHQGKRFDVLTEEMEPYHGFVAACRAALAGAGVAAERVLFQLEHPESWYGAAHFELHRVMKRAHITADRLPEHQWASAARDDWIGVVHRGDRIEMWETIVQRRGNLYRVVQGSYTSTRFDASYSESVDYVGARRGAMRFAGY